MNSATVYDWRHYLAVIQRKPGALRNGAPFAELPPAFRALQQRMLSKSGGDREMVDILALVLQHDEQVVLAAVELALEAGAPTKMHILNLLHRLVDGKPIDAPPVKPPIRTPSAGTFTLGLTGGREVARASFNSNKSLGFNLGWQYAFAKNLMGSAYATYTDSRYDQRESPYPEKRHDRRTVAGVDFIYNWEEIGSELLLSYSHTWNLSNLPLYRYNRDTVSLAVRKSF